MRRRNIFQIIFRIILESVVYFTVNKLWGRDVEDKLRMVVIDENKRK